MRHFFTDHRCAHLSCRALKELLRALLSCDGEPPQWRITALFKAKGVSFTATGDIEMDFKDTDLPGTVTFSVDPPVDAKGKLARLDGVPVWALDDETNCQIVSQAEDGLSCQVHISDNPSATQLSIKGDADMGAGVTEIQSVAVINIVPGDAVAFGAGEIKASAIVPD